MDGSKEENLMNQPNKAEIYQHILDYEQIPDFVHGMKLPDKITVLYCRLSKDDYQKNKGRSKEDDSNSIANQKQILGKLATDNRLPNPIFFTEM